MSSINNNYIIAFSEALNAIKSFFKTFINSALFLLISFLFSFISPFKIIQENFYQRYSLSTFLLNLFIILIIVYIIFFVKVLKKINYNVYGEAIILINQSFAQLHKYNKDKNKKTIEEKSKSLLDILNLFCNNLSNIFTIISNSKCNASIKIILNNGTDPEIKNIAANDEKRKNRIETDAYRNIKHTLYNNTPYILIVNKITNNEYPFYYLNNNVNNSKDYINSSKELDKGLYPYNSEYVVPIIPSLGVNNHISQILGFICIDSTKENAFIIGKQNYYMEILNGIADGVYIIIEKIIEQNKQN